VDIPNSWLHWPNVLPSMPPPTTLLLTIFGWGTGSWHRPRTHVRLKSERCSTSFSTLLSVCTQHRACATTPKPTLKFTILNCSGSCIFHDFQWARGFIGWIFRYMVESSNPHPFSQSTVCSNPNGFEISVLCYNSPRGRVDGPEPLALQVMVRSLFVRICTIVSRLGDSVLVEGIDIDFPSSSVRSRLC